MTLGKGLAGAGAGGSQGSSEYVPKALRMAQAEASKKSAKDASGVSAAGAAGSGGKNHDFLYTFL